MKTTRAILFLLVMVAPLAVRQMAQADDDHFENHVRPLLAKHCWKCHGKDAQEANLRLDLAEGIRKGGDSGAVLVPGKPNDSLLIKAVRQTADLEMPPNGKLKNSEIEHLVRWISNGAQWPNDSGKLAVATESSVRVMTPEHSDLKPALQLWLKADSLTLKDNAPVHVWPDRSGRGGDLTYTAGIRANGVGTPPTWIQSSTINGRSAVRFAKTNGLGASPDNVVDIKGDAAISIVMVCRVDLKADADKFGNLFMIGDAAHPGDPGKPKASYLEIEKHGAEFQLDYAGGWSHDAKLGPGSGKLMESPHILSVIKKPGPVAPNLKVFFNGRPSGDLLAKPISGTQAVPDIQHRTDIGFTIGKAQGWQGGIAADIAEVIVFNRAISEVERRGLEAYLESKYGFLTEEMLAKATRRFTDADRSHWSFQPVRDAKVPAIANDRWSRNPIDKFVLKKLQSKNLVPAQATDRRTFIRRATYGLLGLPPTPAEVNAFVNDPQPENAAINHLIDRLLESPHYGEHWGRKWLDVVRYADTTANDGNFVMRYAFRYRDWVVNSLNKDLPYDQFVRDQLAGDLVNSPDAKTAFDRNVATGFLMVGPKALAEADKEQTKLDIADEQLDVTSRAFMGLTVGCARCHDHKFDPIPTVDYYSLAGIFRSTEVFSDLVQGASKWLEFPFSNGGKKMVPIMAVRDGRIADLRIHIRGSRQRLGMVAPRRFLQVLKGEGHQPIEGFTSGRLQLANWMTEPTHPLTARVMVNRIWQGHFGTGLVPSSDNFGIRGQPPSHPELLDWLATRFIESGWSVKAMHRLMMNSATYRQRVLSAKAGGPQRSLDPTNRLLWNFPRRRLTAEQIRDSILSVAGNLDKRVGGGELVQKLYEIGEKIDAKRGIASASRVSPAWDGFKSNRRSLYLPVIRNGQPAVLALFDVADPNNVTGKRTETTVSSQSAFMLNSDFVLSHSRKLAERITDNMDTDEIRLSRLYLLVLGRAPTELEQGAALAFISDIQKQLQTRHKPRVATVSAWQGYAQVLFCLNEFFYLE